MQTKQKTFKLFERKIVSQILEGACSKEEAIAYARKNRKNRWAWETLINRSDVTAEEILLFILESKINVIWQWAIQKPIVIFYLEKLSEYDFHKMIIDFDNCEFTRMVDRKRKIDWGLIKELNKKTTGQLELLSL